MPEAGWTRCFDPRPEATITLVCVPHAGAGASLFRVWGRLLPDWVEVRAVQLPGREDRLREPLPTHLDRLADELTARLEPLTPAPYALYGHSMGALLAFETARRLEAAGCQPPTRLLLAGYGAPHAFRNHNRLHTLPDDQLLAELRRTQAVPLAVLEAPELMRLLTTILRADLRMCAEHRNETPDEITVNAAISAFAGADDPDVPVASVAAWAEVTTSSFRFRVLPGGHFFVAEDRALLLQAIEHDLATALWTAV